MYHAHFGLTATPFTSQPAPAHYVATPGHEEALARLEFLSETQSSSGLLVGPPGSGKTLLLEVLARSRRRKGMAAAVVSAAQADVAELQFLVAAQFGVSLSGSLPASRLTRALADRLTELRYDQIAAVLLVDDLDRAGEERLLALDEFLASLPHAAHLTIVMAGSPESVERLPCSMAQRADLRIEVPAWDESDVRQFLASCLARCGCTASLFDDGAVATLLEACAGNPRRVSQMANLTLVAAAASGLTTIDSETVEEVCRELCFDSAYTG